MKLHFEKNFVRKFPKDSDDNFESAGIPMKKGEFIRRFAKHIIPQLLIDEHMALQAAEASWEDWDGIYTPEEMADEEVYAWASSI